MFEKLNQTMAAEPAEEALRDIPEGDLLIDDVLAGLENISPLTSEIALAQEIEAELDQLEHLRAAVQEHGTSKALIVAFNQNGALEQLLGVGQAALETMPANLLISRLDDAIAHADPEKSVAVESSGEAWMGLIEGVLQALSGLGKLFVVHLPTSWRLRLRRYNDSVAGKIWDAVAADKTTMKAPTFASLKDELALAGNSAAVLKAIWGGEMPTTEEAYKAWADGVAKAIAPYKAIYGISVESKGWFIKRPKLVIGKIDPKYKLEDMLPGKLGYGDSAMPQLAKTTEQMLTALPKEWNRVVREAELSVKATKQKIANKDDGFFAKFGQRHVMSKAAKLGHRLTMAICMGGVLRMTTPKAVATVGQLRQYYRAGS